MSAIRFFRQKAGMTQKQCAALYGCSRQCWAKYEKMCPRIMVKPTLLRVCEVLGVDAGKMSNLVQKMEKQNDRP